MEPHIITMQQADGIVAEARAPHDALILLLAYAGLRVGEGFAPRRENVDLVTRTITVSHEVVEIAG